MAKRKRRKYSAGGSRRASMGKTGAKYSSWSAGARKLVRDVLETMPHADEDTQIAVFLRRVLSEDGVSSVPADGLIAQVAKAFFKNAKTSYYRRKKRKKDQEATLKRRMKFAQEYFDRLVVGGAKELLKSTTQLGKLVSECTKNEMELLGGWHARVASKMRATGTVADHFTEDQLRDFL